MSNTTKNISYSVATELSPITIELTPEFVQVISGQPIVFTTQGSASYDGSPLSFTWSLDVPVGASVSSVEVSTDTTEARLYPDVNGVYKVTVVATNESGAESIKSAYAVVTSTQSTIKRSKGDYPFIGSAISSFWSVLDNKAVIESLWAEYVNVLSADYRKAAEVVLSKSIDTIQPGRVSSNIVFNTHLDLKPFKHTLRAADPYCGTGTGTTSVKNFLFNAVIMGATKVKLLGVTGNSIEGVSQDARLQIYSSNTGISGQYTIASTQVQDIELSPLTPIPTPGVAPIVSIKIIQGSRFVYVGAQSVVKGDVLLIQNRLYTVTDDYSTKPSLTTGYVDLDREPLNVAIPSTGIVYVRLYKPVAVSIEPSELGMTNKIYVPASELGGHGAYSIVLETRSLAITSPTTILVPYDTGSNLVGASIMVTKTKYAGLTCKIVDYSYDSNYKAAVYTVSPPLSIPPEEFGPTLIVQCKVTRDNNLKNILITTGNLSAPISSISYFKDYKDKSYAALIVQDKVFLQNAVNLDWRVSSTIITTSLTSSIDYPKEGVRSGDVLHLEVSTSITDARSSIQCTVVGAYKNSISFEAYTGSLVSDTGTLLKPSIEDKVVASVFKDLRIPSAALKGDSTYLFSSLASDIRGMLQHSAQLLRYADTKLETFSNRTANPGNTLFVTDTTPSNSIARLGIKPTHIVRNGMFPIKVTEPVASIPSLTEFVYSKETSTVTGSTDMAILHKDNSVSYLDRGEYKLLENIGFFIKNNTEFSGTDLDKPANSMTIESSAGFFIDRGVDSGDILTIDGVEYVVKQVLSSTTIRLLRTEATTIFESTKLSDKGYTVKQVDTYPYPYIQFRPGLFSVSNPAPKHLFATTVIIDNVRQIEQNFGVLVGYSIKEFYDYSSPQISYLNAIRGLMYAITNGPTVSNIELATAILLNLPVTQKTAVILDIDKTNGRIVVQPIDTESGDPVDQPIHHTYTTLETIEPFNDIRYNTITGEAFKIGDIVEKFTPLTSKVVVTDYVHGDFNFLTQFHKWKISIDANSINSRDLPLLAKFYDYARPIHTKPGIELVLYLLTKVTVIPTLRIEGTIKFYDDPGFGLELSHSYDAYNQSGQVLRLADKGELSTRTLFLGKDLVATSTTEVSSSRGGFLLNSPDDFTDDPGQGVQNDVKELQASAPFTGIHFVRGRNLIKAGDILRIYTGINHGIYSITQVDSDSQLTIAPLADYGIYTRTPEVSTDPAKFGIYRLVQDIIVSGIQCSAFNNSSNTSTFAGTSLNWDGVAVGDVLVKSGDHTAKYTILDIPYNSITEDAAVTLTLDSLAGISTAGTYFIYRPVLIPRISNSGSVTSYNSGDPRHVVHNLTDEYKIEVGDQFVLTSSASAEKYARVTRVQSGSFEISHDLSLAVSSTFEIRKTGHPISYQNESYGSERASEGSSDARLELLHGYDDVSVEITSVSAIATATALANTASGLAIKDISGLSVLPEPCDKIYLYDGLNNEVFVGTVYYQTSNSVVCFSDADNISDHAVQYKVKISRRSRP